jgi:hypothetical protein
MHEAYFEEGDDGHGCARVVEGGEQNAFRSAVHELQRVTKCAQEAKCLLGKVDPDLAVIASMVEQVAHGVEADFLNGKLVHVAHTQQRFEVREGDCWRAWWLATNKVAEGAMVLTPPSTLAIATAGAEVGVLVGQGRRLYLEDGVGVGILRRDGCAALALAH